MVEADPDRKLLDDGIEDTTASELVLDGLAGLSGLVLDELQQATNGSVGASYHQATGTVNGRDHHLI